jgi:hypothetical protein
MPLRIQDLMATGTISEVNAILEISDPTQTPTSRRATLAQLLGNVYTAITTAISSEATARAAADTAEATARAAADTAETTRALAAEAVLGAYPQVGLFNVGAGLTIIAKGAGSAGADITANAGHIALVRHSAHQWLFGVYGHFTGVASNSVAQAHFHLIWTTGAKALLDAFVADSLANMTSVTGLPGILQDDVSAGYGRPFFAHLNPNTSGFGTGNSGIDLYTDIGNAYWPTAAFPNFAVSGLVATA